MPGLSTSEKDFLKQVKQVNPKIKVIGKFKGVNKKVELKCSVCSHEWLARAKVVMTIPYAKACPRCNMPNAGLRKVEYFEKIKAKYGNSIKIVSKYKSIREPITFVCESGHKITKNTARELLTHGCSICSRIENTKDRRFTHEEFLTRFNARYANNLIILKGKYLSKKSIFTVKCKDGHVFKSSGAKLSQDCYSSSRYCSICFAGVSAVSIECLNYVAKKSGYFIRHGKNKGEHKIKDTKYLADGYIEELNTIIEFHGMHWHGGKDGCRNMKRRIKTMRRTDIIRAIGYRVIEIWEEDWYDNSKACIKRVVDILSRISKFSKEDEICTVRMK